MHETEEVKMELEKIKEIKKNLISAIEFAVSQGVFSSNVEAKELGEVVDMVKDLAETDKNCWEACYYKSVVKAMEESSSENPGMGYNSNRYANGQYAPSGHGNSSGYTNMMIPPYYETMGYGSSNNSYSGNSNQGNSNGRNNSSSGYSRSQTGNKFGTAYDEYMDARKHYHESKSLNDKEDMDKKALEHVNDSVMTLRDIWKNADPSVQKEVRTAMKKLTEEFDQGPN